MPDLGIKVTGGAKLRRAMRAAGDDLENLGAAHRAAEAVVLAKGASNAPRRSGKLAGNLRGTSAKTYAAVRVGGKRLPYAGPIHWGWGAGSRVRGSYTGNSFLTDAAKQTEPAWAPIYFKAVQDAVDTVNRVKG